MKRKSLTEEKSEAVQKEAKADTNTADLVQRESVKIARHMFGASLA